MIEVIIILLALFGVYWGWIRNPNPTFVVTFAHNASLWPVYRLIEAEDRALWVQVRDLGDGVGDALTTKYKLPKGTYVAVLRRQGRSPLAVILEERPGHPGYKMKTTSMSAWKSELKRDGYPLDDLPQTL